MNVQSAFNSGIQGFQTAVDSANQAASDIARSVAYQPEENTIDASNTEITSDENRSSENLPDLNQSIIDLKIAEYQAKASVKVVKTADENLGTLLDVSI